MNLTFGRVVRLSIDNCLRPADGLRLGRIAKHRTNGRSRMSIGRRETSNSRRRRMLVYQNSREDVAETAADRRQFEKLREARRPSEIYGTSVNRRLRGRWFSLVPVRRRAMAGVAIVILGIAAILCVGHWIAVIWQPLAYRPELARPLRLDRPDSFGAWVRAAFFAAAAGTSLLVYQLRRYRNDDFRGSYRIWPPVIVLMVLSSLDAVCQLVPWGGELIELVMGRRVALAGSDWIRIVLTVGGIALAMRVIAEVRHSKLAIVMMSSAISGFAIPIAARWGIFASETPVRWLMITSAPMMASAALWIACGAYLRKLFREVRKMDAEDALSLRIEQWRERVAAMRLAAKRDKEEAAAVAKENKAARKSNKPPAKKPGSFDADTVSPRPAVAVSNVAPAQAARQTLVPSGEKDESGEEPKESKKSRFSLRFWRRSLPPDDSDDARNDAVNGGQSAQAVPKSAAVAAPVPVKNPEPVAAKPLVAASQTAIAASQTVSTSTDAAAAEDAKGKKGGLFGWFGKKKEADAKPGAQTAAAKRGAVKSSNEEDDGEVGDGDDPSIDWASMGKAERRRLRREMKRGGQAA